MKKTPNILAFISIAMFIIGSSKLLYEIIKKDENRQEKKIIYTYKNNVIEDNFLIINGTKRPYLIYENEELKTLSNLITRDCRENEICKIERAFEYVTNKPYELSDQFRKPDEVIAKGGDCDEKSFLFASLLNMTGNKSITIYTKDHAFIGVKITSLADVFPHHAKIEIGSEYYYFAETTAKGSYIGWDNGIDEKDIEMIYSNNEKREIKDFRIIKT